MIVASGRLLIGRASIRSVACSGCRTSIWTKKASRSYRSSSSWRCMLNLTELLAITTGATIVIQRESGSSPGNCCGAFPGASCTGRPASTLLFHAWEMSEETMVENSNILLPPGGQRILVVMAHPDDAEFLCGGTIARLTAQGCEVSYLLATRGQRGSDDPAMTPERLAVIREAEQRRAAEVLGVRQVLFLDYVDGDVEPSLQMRREIARMVRLLKPEVVFTFDPWQLYQVHPDHRAVGLCTLDALAASRNLMYYTEQFAET